MINRRVEYLSATIMVGWSGLLAVVERNSVSEGDAFTPMIERGWTEGQLTFILGAFGVTWLIALWINGHWRRSPVMRCICAGGGVIMWSHLWVMLLLGALETGIWSTGLAVYGALALFDLASCYRSAADAYLAHVHGQILDEARSTAGRHEL